MSYFYIISFLGGIGLFVFGMEMMGDALQKLADSKMKNLLSALIKNKFMGVIVGALVTAIIHSSAGTTVMTVGFVNAGIMSLEQAVGVVMGANIGTTITSLMLALGEIFGLVGEGGGTIGFIATMFNPEIIAPVGVGIGAFMVILAKKEKTKYIGEIILGFGMLFVGMTQMKESMLPLQNVQFVKDLLVNFGNNPILGILVGAIITALLQSSTASVGILQALAIAGLVPYSAAVYIILGQNIGTCFTAILSGFGANKNAKSVGYIHLFFNVIGSVLFCLVVAPYFKFINPVFASSKIDATGISLVHIVHNVLSTIVLYPFSNQLIKLAEFVSNKFTFGEKTKELEGEELFLDERVLSTPSFAMEMSIDAIDKLGFRTLENLKLSVDSLLTKDKEKAHQVFENEKKINEKEKLITSYILKIVQKNLTSEESEKAAYLLKSIGDIERVADHAENIAELAVGTIENEIKFSEKALEELIELTNLVILSFESSLKSLLNGDMIVAKKVGDYEMKVNELESSLRKNHLARVSEEKCDTESGIIFFETLINLERIGDHANNIAQGMLK